MPRMLIVSEIRLYREGLAACLACAAGFEVVGEADSGWAAVALAAELGPDLILVDHSMPDLPGVLRGLADAAPSAKLVGLGVREDAAEVVAGAEAGLAGFVRREASVDELLGVLEGVVRGELRCSPAIAGTLLRRLAWRATTGSATEPPELTLTLRERQIAELIDQGLSNKEIASRLGVEVATVKNHVHNLLEKLNVHRRGEAAARLRGAPHPRTGLPRTSA